MVTIKHGWEIHIMEDNGGLLRKIIQRHGDFLSSKPRKSHRLGIFLGLPSGKHSHSYFFTFPLLVDLPSFFRYGGSFQFVNCQRWGFFTYRSYWMWMLLGLSYDSVPVLHRVKAVHCTALGHLFPHGHAIFEIPQMWSPKKVENRDLPLFQWDFRIFLGVTKKLRTTWACSPLPRLASLPSKGNSAPTQWSDLGWLVIVVQYNSG